MQRPSNLSNQGRQAASSVGERLPLDPTSRASAPARVWLVNLLLPGLGLVLLDAIIFGTAVALSYIVVLNGTLAVLLLIPDDVPQAVELVLIGTVCAVHISGQFALRAVARSRGRDRIRERRVALVAHANQLLQDDRGPEALSALLPIAGDAESDLDVAYCLALAFTQTEDRPAACEAWERVRRVDQDGIYAVECRVYLKQLAPESRS